MFDMGVTKHNINPRSADYMRPQKSKLLSVIWIYFLSMVAVSAFVNTTNGLIACFRLARDGSDSIGSSSLMSLSNAPFVHGTLYLNGYYEFGSTTNGYRATAAIPGLNYESFGFAIDFYPLPTGRRTGPNRVERFLDYLTRGDYAQWFGHYPRNDSNILTGGTSYRWLGFRLETNLLQLTLNNQEFTHTFVHVEPGHWHNLICSLDLHRRQILTMLDGQRLETVYLPKNFKLDVIGSGDDVSDRAFTFVNYSNGSVFHGFAANLKVFGASLTASELDALYQAISTERPQFNPRKVPFSAVAFVLLGVCGLPLAFLVNRWRFQRRMTFRIG